MRNCSRLPSTKQPRCIAGPNEEISSAEISRALVHMRALWQHTYGLVEVG